MEHKRYLLLVYYSSEGWQIGLEDDSPEVLLDGVKQGVPGPWLIVKLFQ